MLAPLQIAPFIFDAPHVRHLENIASSSSSFSVNIVQKGIPVEPCSPGLKMTAKRYTSGFSGDNTFGLTLLFAHGVGSHKEQWEPTIERIFLTQATKERHHQIREAWSFDWQNHGDAALVNEEALRGRHEGVSIYEWAPAIIEFVLSPRMVGHRIVPLGHSAGAGAMMLTTKSFLLSHLPYVSLILIEPTMITREMFEAHFDDRIRSMEMSVGATEVRRDVWPDREEAFRWLSRRFPFRTWDPRVVRLLVEQGLYQKSPGSKAVSLKCDRKQEAISYPDVDGHFEATTELARVCRTLPVHVIWGTSNDMFVLLEQPNGYFVLNDIFRFLKEDAVEGDSDEVASDSVSAPEPVAVPAEYPREPSPPPSPPVEVVDATAAPVEEPPVTVAEIAEPEPLPAPVSDELTATHLNGYEVEKPATPAPVSRTPTPEPTHDVAPTPPPAAAVIAPSPSPTPAPAASATTPAPPAPAAAPVPKTWANLAASNTKKWGNAVAHDSRGSSENVSNSPAVASSSGTQTPVKPSGTPSRTPHPAYAAAQSVTTAQCFIKSVTEPISSQALTQALTRFGPLKGTVEIVRYKACAFAEFTTVDAARRAIILSLPPVAGGEGGVKVDIGGGETLKIIVETKKERGDRPASRGRGGPPFAGEGRGASSSDGRGGGFRGSARGSGRGRGAK